MAQIDDAINNLSSDELDTLNSDPQMLADFKAKYVPPSIIGSVGDIANQAIKTALPSPAFNQPLSPTSPNPAIGGAQAALQTLRDPTRISPTISQPGQELGKTVKEKTGSPVAGFVSSVLADPQTYLGIGNGEIPTGMQKQLSKLGEVLTGVDRENFIKLANDPQAILNMAPSSVTGKALQAAKDAAGITPAENRILAISTNARRRIYSKVMDKIDAINNPQLANAPAMEEDVIGATTKDLQKGDELMFTHPSKPSIKATYNAPSLFKDAKPEQIDPMIDLKDPVPNPNATWSHPKDSTLSVSTMKNYGYNIPKELQNLIPDSSPANISVTDLLQAKKAGQMISQSDPSASGLIQKEIHEKINPLLKTMAPDIYNAQQAVHLSKVKESFMNIFPQGKGMMNYFRTVSMLAGSMFHGIGALESPAVAGAATIGTTQAAKYALTSGGAITAGKAFGLNQINPDSYSGLQSLRDRLNNQGTNQ